MIGSSSFKKFVKSGITKIIATQTDKIEHAIGQAEIISFDIFDTLIKRNVIAPERVHDIVHDEFLKQTGVDIPDYLGSRINAEREAREHTQKEEISLKKIFCYLSGISETDKILLQELEKKIEMEVCCPNLLMKAIYEKALKEGKHVIITSDMYLEEQTIRKILDKCGYSHYEKLYLSSHFGLCKATGSIYEVIKKDYVAFSVKKILHIGDNLKGDYIMPKKRGINALLIDGERNLLRFWKKKNKNIRDQFIYQRLYSFVNNHVSGSCNDAVSIAYEVLGPMLLGYCTWLNAKVKKDNIEKVFFLSREGKIFQEAFNILYPQNNIPQTYLYVSRRALLVPLLTDANDFDEMIDTLKYFLHTPFLSTICTICGLEKKKFKKALKDIDLSMETKIHEIPNEKKEKVYSIIRNMGGCHFKQQKKYVLEYLKESGFKGNIAIVDIGWSGTMQSALQKYIVNSNTILHGYYLGVRNMEVDDYYTSMFRSGYLFEPGKNEEFDLMARFTTEIFEILFLNQTGSVQGYDLKGDKIEPILDDPEYVGFEGEFIEALQKTALEFLKLVRMEEIWNEKMTIQEDIVMSSYAQFAVYPSMSTIKVFERFQFSNSGMVRKLLPEYSFFYYIFHIKNLIQDFNQNMCKIFFMKKLFKVCFPYFRCLELLVTKCNVKSEYRKRYLGMSKNE